MPSRSRPEQLLNVATKYVHMADDMNNTRILVNMDDDDPTFTSDLRLALTSLHSNVNVIGGRSDNKIHAINRDMPDPSTFDIVLLASDDMIPQVGGYDTIIRNKMREKYPDLDGVLFFNDGFNKDSLNTILLCGSTYYKRFGYLYYPGYKSFFCDNEFMHVANKLKRQTYIDHVIIKHEHPHTNKEIEMDELYIRNQGPFIEDQELFLRRAKFDFETPLQVGVMKMKMFDSPGLKRLLAI